MKRKKVDLANFIRRSALTSDYSRLIKEDVLIIEDGKPIILYKKIDIDTRYIRQACKNIKYEKDTRTVGLKTESKTFGYRPRNTIRHDFCSASGLAYERPTENALICSFGEHLAKMYAEYFPETFKLHNDLSNAKILPDWKITNTPFTSGIVNKNNPLKYHFDAGNINDVFSNMVVFKHDVQGGYLSIPELDIALECCDNSVVLFNGQEILHGVTPIYRLSPESYRYSIVYYTLKQIWNCLPLDEEVLRVREKHTERETNRSNVQMEELMLDSKVKHNKFRHSQILIPSKGRAGRSRLLAENKGFKVFVEPQELELYKKAYPSHEIIDIGKNDAGSFNVRNTILDYAKKNNIKTFWQLDDDISNFYRREGNKMIKCQMNEALSSAEQQFKKNKVNLGALEYQQIAWSATQDIRFSGYCDVCVFFNLPDNCKLSYRDVGGSKADRDFAMQVLKDGLRNARTTLYAFGCPTPGTNSGGLKKLYYNQNKIENCCNKLVEIWGENLCTKIVKKNGELDVKINWKAIAES